MKNWELTAVHPTISADQNQPNEISHIIEGTAVVACFAVIVTTNFKVYQTFEKEGSCNISAFELLLRSGNYQH